MLTARQSDIANYVNSGRGLIGFSSDFGVAAYSYLAFEGKPEQALEDTNVMKALRG